MKRYYSSMIAMVAGILVLASSAAAAPRAQQIAFNYSNLQNRLNMMGESINVATDQQEGLIWGSNVSSNSTMTIQFNLSGSGTSNELGVVRVGAGGQLPGDCACVFPVVADSGWFAVASFRSNGNMIVTLFDEYAMLRSQVTHTNIDRTRFAYYVKRNGLEFYSHDGYNDDGKAHALAFAGTGENQGSWWLAWEDSPISDYGNADFGDALVFMEALNPTPVAKTSWGNLKKRFR